MIALVGTGLTTVVLALLAYDLAEDNAGAVVGIALALKRWSSIAMPTGGSGRRSKVSLPPPAEAARPSRLTRGPAVRPRVERLAEDPVWSDAERTVFRLADELHETSGISDELFAELERHFAAPRIIELCIPAAGITRSRT